MTARDAVGAGGGPRARLVARLRELDRPMSVAELVDASGLHRNTVARHLDALVESGVVVRSYDSRGRRGRPVGLYRLAPSAPESGYAELAGLLARRLDRTATDGEAQRLGDEWARAVLQREEQRPGRGAVEVLTDMGFEPTVSDDGHTLELHRCPLVSDRRPIPTVCTLHSTMVRALVEADGVDAAHLAAQPFVDGGPCHLHIGPGSLRD